MKNTQPIEHETSDLTDIDIHSIFATIQGEGPFAGTPATFVRLAGCNLKCPACDTDYTSQRERLTISQALHKTMVVAGSSYALHGKRLIVLTGGEPFRQKAIGLYVRALIRSGYNVQIETNGTLWQPGPWDAATIICSPKTPRIDRRLTSYISGYKYIVDSDNIDPNDGLPSDVMGTGLRPGRPPTGYMKVYVQPLDEKNEDKNRANLAAAVQSCLKFGYILSLQIHKIIGVD